MKKSDYIAIQNENWGDTTLPKRIPVNDRNVGDAISGQLWSSIVNEDTSSVLSITSQVNLNIVYKLAFRKSGNIVNVIGIISNTSVSAVASSSEIIGIVNTEYNARSGFGTYYKQDLITFLVSGNKMYAIPNFPPLTTVRVNFNYYTND